MQHRVEDTGAFRVAAALASHAALPRQGARAASTNVSARAKLAHARITDPQMRARTERMSNQTSTLFCASLILPCQIERRRSSGIAAGFDLCSRISSSSDSCCT
eukprot:245314-Pleurochrysis_carterae.AAC.1